MTQRIAAVTGASSGIGRAIGLALAARGWSVALGARRVARLEEVAALAGARGDAALAHPLDVRDPASIEAFFDAAETKLGAVTCLVSCAGTGRPGRIDEMTPEQIRAEVETDFFGPLLLARRAIAGMRSRALPGDLVFVSSTSAAVPWPFHVPYAASKAGVENAARALALELEGCAIRSLVVRVGNTMGTEWASRWGPEEAVHIGAWAKLGLIRHGGLLAPEQVAAAVASALDTPRGVQLGTIEVHPEAPAETKD
jgi:NAD(P)-dependent dehydrogenase (short-subunit alcohol dehydrogenase family)